MFSAADDAHFTAAAHDLLEQAEAALLEVPGYVADDQRIAQVRLVAAVFQHRLGIGNAWEFARRRHALAVRELLEHARQHRLYRLKDVFLRHKAHLEVELVEFRAAIGAQILVAEAGRDLEITVEAGHHQQLLEHLRRLRERIEAARMEAAGDEIVTCAFGAGRTQNRGLKLGETLLDHTATDR